MMTGGTSRVARSVIGARFFSSGSTVRYGNGGAGVLTGGVKLVEALKGTAASGQFSVGGVRGRSTLTLGEKEQKETGSAGGNGEDGGKAVASYWGIKPEKVIKEDGTPWKWKSFRPWETYEADLKIDLKKHHVPTTFLDKLAYWTVKSLRFPTDVFFQRRYGCRAMMLETVAAVPGMVGGLLLHCKSLRRFEHSGGWIKTLLDEAENERMHLMTFMEVSQPRWYERALVFTVQGVFFNAYFLAYLASPKLAHRVVGYLEEEAIHSYTEFLKELDKGTIENVPAPAINFLANFEIASQERAKNRNKIAVIVIKALSQSATLSIQGLELQEQRIIFALKPSIKHNSVHNIIHHQLQSLSQYDSSGGRFRIGLNVGNHAGSFILPPKSVLLDNFVGKERDGHDSPHLPPVFSIDGEHHVLPLACEDIEDDVAGTGPEFNSLSVEYFFG